MNDRRDSGSYGQRPRTSGAFNAHRSRFGSYTAGGPGLRYWIIIPSFVVAIVGIIMIVAMEGGDNVSSGTSTYTRLQDYPGQSFEVDRYRGVDMNVTPLSEVLAKRELVVSKHPDLIADYEPHPALFAEIDESAPWRSRRGFILVGSPERRSHKALFPGVSEASLILLNPLVPFHIFSFQRSPYNAHFIWKPQAADVYAPDAQHEPYGFGLYPYQVKWEPKEGQVTMRYRLLEYLNAQKEYLKVSLPDLPFQFGLIPLNARGLGFEYIAVDKKQSENIKLPKFLGPARNFSRFSLAPYCGPSKAGCNTIRGTPSFLRSLVVIQVPATLAIDLWRSTPGGQQSNRGELRVLVSFE